MSREAAQQVVRQIRTLYATGSAGGMTDAELVERFLGRQGVDREEAFAALVGRHGPMVLGVCRRMLRGPADADDAFQAVFLVLARRAGAVRRVEGLKSWLHGVAIRTAKEARRRSARRHAMEGAAFDESRALAPTVDGRGDLLDLLDLLDEELRRLPIRYRDPLILCELEGVSRRDAASRLGLPEGTVSSRLARGRSLLRDRLARRGVALGTVGIGSLGADPVHAAVPGPLADDAVRLALKAPGGTIVPAERLARAVGRTAVPWSRTIPAAALAVVLAGLAIASGGPDPVIAKIPTPAPAAIPDDPLPAGATLRFGSSRYRHPSRIEGLAISPDGSVAVATSGTLANGAVLAYDLATGRVRRSLGPVAAEAEAVAFAPDGKTIAALRDFTVTLVDVATGEETARIGYPGANPSTRMGVLDFSPDGKWIAVVAPSGKAIQLLDVARRKASRTLPHTDIVFAAAISPDGRLVAGGGYDRDKGGYFARLWDANTGAEIWRLGSSMHGIRCLAFSADGSTLALGADYGNPPELTLFDIATGKERRTIPCPGESSLRSLAFSPDGRTLAASGRESTRLFDTGTGAVRVTIDRHAIGLRFSPDGATLIGAVAGAIERWDAITGKSLIPAGGESPVARIAATPDGTRVVSLGEAGDGHIWDARTGVHQRRVPMSFQRGFALSPDGRFLVWPEGDEAIKFKDLERAEITHTGSRLRMMDLATGALVERFGGFEGEAHDLDFIDGGKSLVTVDHWRRDAGVRIWNFATGKVARSFPAEGMPGARTWRSRLSPDGKVLAVLYQGPMRGLSIDSEVKLWDLATGKELGGQTPRWFEPDVLAFGPDGKSVATVTRDGLIRVRDVETWLATREFHGPRNPTALGFGPNGRIFSGMPDATVLAWDAIAASR